MSKSNKSWLSRAQLDALDEKLFDYPKINQAIATRKVQLQITHDHDSNIGGSKSTRISKPPEDELLKKEEYENRLKNDILLKNLYLFRDTVEKMFAELPDELKVIFQIRWIDGGKTWIEIEHELFYAEKTIYKKRVAILERFAECAGYLKIG